MNSRRRVRQELSEGNIIRPSHLKLMFVCHLEQTLWLDRSCTRLLIRLRHTNGNESMWTSCKPNATVCFTFAVFNANAAYWPSIAILHRLCRLFVMHAQIATKTRRKSQILACRNKSVLVSAGGLARLSIASGTRPCRETRGRCCKLHEQHRFWT